MAALVVDTSMRYSRQTNYPDWDDKQCLDHKIASKHHHRKRTSHSSAHESKRCKYNHDETYDSLYSDADAFHEDEREHQERRYVEEYRNNYSQLSETKHQCRDHENGYHNHSSKSSGHSVQSSHKRKHRTHHDKSDRQSHTV